MPLAAVVSSKVDGTDNKYFCVNGGIGNSIRMLSDLDVIQRPLEILSDTKIY